MFRKLTGFVVLISILFVSNSINSIYSFTFFPESEILTKSKITGIYDAGKTARFGDLQLTEDSIYKNRFLYLPNFEDSIATFDLITRKLKIELNDIKSETPCLISGNYLYISVPDSSFLCINLKTKNVKWSFDKDKESIWMIPVIYKDYILLCTESEIVLLNKEDGKQIWKFRGKTSHRPVIIEDMIFVEINETLNAIDLKSGEIRWKYKTSCKVSTPPLIYNNQLLLFCEYGKIEILNINTGESIKKIKVINAEFSNWDEPPAVSNGNIIYFTDVYGNLYSLEYAGGKISLLYEAPYFTTNIERTSYKPSLVGNKLYHRDGEDLIELDIDTYIINWKCKIDSFSFQSPIFLNRNKIYLFCEKSLDDLILYSIKIEKSDEKWVNEIKGNLFCSPKIWKDRLYIMRDSKLLECYKKDNGEFLWSVKVPTKVENLFQIDSDRIFIGDYKSIFVYDYLSGKLIKEIKFTENNEFKYESYCVKSKNIYLFIEDYVKSYDIETGEMMWETFVFSSPEFPLVQQINDLLYVSYMDFMEIIYYLRCINPENGQKLWEISSDYYFEQLEIRNNVLFYYEENSVKAINIYDGNQLWRTNIPCFNKSIKITSDSKYLYVCLSSITNNISSYMLDIISLSIEDGKELWSETLIHSFGFGYKVQLINIKCINSNIVLCLNSMSLLTFNSISKKFLWVYYPESAINEYFQIDENTLYLSTRAGFIYAITI
jgi:outer membrane protein assembly factor BamB